jgi:uncharacterized protein (DUF58 family)
MAQQWRGCLTEGARAAAPYTLAVPRLAPHGQQGLALSQRAGSSLEFKDHRAYEPGDDLRHIDWNAYARSDQLTVKLYREEIAPHLDLVLDCSASMDLEGTRKGEATAALAAFFATAAGGGGYSHQLWRVAGRFSALPDGNRPPDAWEGLAFDHRGEPEPTQPPWRARATRMLISDLFWLGEPARFMRPFAETAASAVVVQLLAHADVEPPEGESVRLVDSETDGYREIHVDAAVARTYREAFARHQQNWHDACRQVGAAFVQLVAERLLAGWDMSAFVAAEVLRVV